MDHGVPRRTWPIRWGLLIVSAGLLIALVATPAGAAELVTFPGGTAISLPADADGATVVEVSVDAANDVRLGGLAVELVSVRRGSAIYTLPSGADPVGAVELSAAASALRLMLDPDDFPHGGETYTVTVRVADLESDAQQIVSLTLMRPASTVTVEPSAIEVAQTVFIPEIGLDSDVLADLGGSVFDDERTPELWLRVGPAGRIHELEVLDVTGDAARFEFSLTCESGGGTEPCLLPAAAKPDDRIRLDYDLAGDFPLGSQTHTIQIRSPQLAAPVEFPIVVVTKRSAILIPLLLIVGILVGVLLRNVLTALGAMSRARADRDELILRLRGLAAATTDATLVEHLGGLAARLGTATALQPKALQQEIESVRAEAKTKLEAHAAALQSLQERTDAWRALATRRTLPGFVAGQLEPARVKYIAAVGAISAGNATIAAGLADELDGVAADTRALVVDWLSDYRDAAGRLVKEAGQSLRIDGLPIEARRLIAALEREAGDAQGAASVGTPAADAPPLDRVLDAAADTALAHTAVFTAAEALADHIQSAAGNEATAIRTALATRDDRTAVEQLGTHVLAAARAVAVRKEDTVLGAEGEVTEPVRAEPPETRTVDELPYAPAPLFDRVALLPGAVLFAGLGKLAGFLKFVVLAVIVTLVGIASWNADWVGTMTDMLGVFAFGFALDLTTDAVALSLSGFGKRPAV